jgi:hypothetical protein
MSEYDTDILTWSEHQSDLLRRLSRGEKVNAQIDWDNVAEEIESVGREQIHAVGSLLFQALLHWLKSQAWPRSLDADAWRLDSAQFRAQAARRFVNSMRQRIDLADIYQDARRLLPPSMGGRAASPVPDECPFTLDQLLARD